MNANVPQDSTEFQIYGIIPYEKVNGNYSLILRSVEDPDTMVSIVIGSPEAQSIAIFLEGPDLDRPLTHDLFCNILLERGIDVDHVIIDDNSEDLFFASIVFNDGMMADCRPSDGISIAIRLGSPIFIGNNIVDSMSFKHAGWNAKQLEPEEKRKTKKKKTVETKKESIEDLKRQLEEAVEKEDYELAAMLRDRIQGA